jgi:hypothetical protein
MRYKSTDILGEAIAARDQANKAFEEVLISQDIEMIRSAILRCQKAENNFLTLDRHKREIELKRKYEDLDNTVIRDAEGKRQFLITQFKALTGVEIL